MSLLAAMMTATQRGMAGFNLASVHLAVGPLSLLTGRDCIGQGR